VFSGGRFDDRMAVLVEGDRIAGVVDKRDVSKEVDREDWGGLAIVPGTVNCHGHSWQSLLKGLGDDRRFEDWRDAVLYPFSERLDGDGVYAGALFAFAEALLSGTTTTVDFFYLHDAGNDNAHRVLRAAHDVGVRVVFARAFYDREAPTRAPDRYREHADDAARRCLELARAYGDDAGVSVHPATIAAALEITHELQVPCHLHLAEARYEREQVRARFGTTPVRLLAREGLLDERLVTIHAVWLDSEEIDLLAEHGVGVVHCPAANAFLGDGIARVPEMLARGVRVGLGPDGGCANNRQSVFDEMRSASLLAKARLTDGSALDALSAFRLGTEAGADLLGLRIGVLEQGRYADLVGLDLDDLSLLPGPARERHLVHSMQPTAVARVMVGGEVVVERGALTRFELAEVRARVEEATKGWTRPGSS
jgi:5-methylthioadenosine/S-adenosylhomocysteine deaminase